MKEQSNALPPPTAEGINAMFADATLEGLGSLSLQDSAALEAAADNILAISDTQNNLPEGYDEAVYVYLKGYDAEGSLRQYLRLIGRIPLLKGREEEAQLAKRIEAGVLAQKALEDDAVFNSLSKQWKTEDLAVIAHDGVIAKRHFIEANLRLVVWQAKRMNRWANHRQSLLDMIQWGNIGLQRAVERFDYKKGFKFSVYAVFWIRKMILENQNQGFGLDLTEHVAHEVRRMEAINSTLHTKIGRLPTNEELAKEMNVTIERILELQSVRKEPLSFDVPLGNEQGSDSFYAVLASPEPLVEELVTERVMKGVARKWIITALQDLARQEKNGSAYADVIIRRFGLFGPAQTLEAIRKVYGKSKETIRKWEMRAMVFLQNKAVEDKFDLA